MTREEFMDLLRYYFRNINQTQVNEILADYESHFEEGKAAGLSEEEIARELGSPKEIFEMYQDEGMIREKKSTTFMDVASQAEKTASQTWEEVSAQLPEKVNRGDGNGSTSCIFTDYHGCIWILRILPCTGSFLCRGRRKEDF